jgi:hypothetical protein
MYPYWCVEKGYARHAGKPDGSASWVRRSRGWVKVMHVDIICSMVIYTIATLAFYLLGAGILHNQGLVPAARDMIQVLSNIYTQSLGNWSLPVFYAGAIATLYGTVFAATAAHSRVFADMFRLMGAFDKNDYSARLRYRRRFVMILTVVPVAFFLLVQSPVLMVVIGGIFQSAMLPVIALATIYLRHRRLPPEVAPNRFVTISLWISGAIIFGTVGVALINSLS